MFGSIKNDINIPAPSFSIEQLLDFAQKSAHAFDVQMGIENEKDAEEFSADFESERMCA